MSERKAGKRMTQAETESRKNLRWFVCPKCLKYGPRGSVPKEFCRCGDMKEINEWSLIERRVQDERRYHDKYHGERSIQRAFAIEGVYRLNPLDGIQERLKGRRKADRRAPLERKGNES